MWKAVRAVRVRALAGAGAHSVLCSRARHLTFTVPLSSQEYTFFKRMPKLKWSLKPDTLFVCEILGCELCKFRAGTREQLLRGDL